MNNAIGSRHNQLNYKLLIFRLRESNNFPLFLYGSMILFCLLLVIFAVVPPIENLISVNQIVDSNRQDIAMLTQNINFLTTLSDTDVANKVLLANAIFPKSKDFNGAIQAINAAAETTSVGISNLSFTVGDLNGKTKAVTSTSPLMQVSVSLVGNNADISHFLQSIETKIPLLSVQSISMDPKTTTVIFQVAYREYVAKDIDLTHVALTLSPKTLQFLQLAQTWQNESSVAISSPVSSQSGSLPPF